MHLEENDENWVNITPNPGEFKFDGRIFSISEEADGIAVVDLNITEDVQKLGKNVVFLDHHLQGKLEGIEYINPVVTEKREVPSASWVVSEYTGIWNHLTAIGSIGDSGVEIFGGEFGDRLMDLLINAGLDENSTSRIADLLDTPSVIGDRNGVEKLVLKVIRRSPGELLYDEELILNLEKIEAEIDRILENIQPGDPAYLEFKSDYNVISKVGRKIVWDMKKKAVIAVNMDYRGMGQVYFRIMPDLSERVPLNSVIRELKNRGFNAGGKKDVLGCLCKKQEIEDVIEIIKSYTGDMIEY